MKKILPSPYTMLASGTNRFSDWQVVRSGEIKQELHTRTPIA